MPHIQEAKCFEFTYQILPSSRSFYGWDRGQIFFATPRIFDPPLDLFLFKSCDKRENPKKDLLFLFVNLSRFYIVIIMSCSQYYAVYQLAVSSTPCWKKLQNDF